MAAFGFVLDTHESLDAHKDAEFWAGLTPNEAFELLYPDLWAEGCRPVVANDNRSEDDASGAPVGEEFVGSAAFAPLVERYAALGLSMISMDIGSKSPKGFGWPDSGTKDAATALRRFGNGARNLGCVLGQRSGGVVDIDLDCPEALALTDHLPATSAVFGRHSTPRSHFIYRVEGFAPTKKFVDPLMPKDSGEKNMIVEVRGDGNVQTVFPPSRHPSGETIAWNQFDEIAVVTYDELVSAATNIAVAVMVERYSDKGRNHPKVKEWLGETVEPQGPRQDDTRRHTGEQPEVGKREIAAAKGLLKSLAGTLAAMGEGARNIALNNAALAMGHEAAAGRIGRTEVYDALYDACRRNGLLAQDGQRAFDATFLSGFEAGLLEPAGPLKDRQRDGAANDSRSSIDKIAESIRQRAARERASSNESGDDAREQHEAPEPNTSARHWLALHRLALSVGVILRRTNDGAWMFAGYTVIGDGNGLIEFAAPMTPDDCIDHLASALPHVFTRAMVESLKRKDYDYDGGQHDGRAQQDTRSQDEIDEDLLSGVNFYDGEVIPPAPKIVKRLIPKNGVGIIGGQSGAGKTFVICDLAAAVSTGEGEFFGHPVRERVGVAILAAEDAGAIRQRLKVAIDYRGPGLVPPATWLAGFDFNTQEGVDDIINRLRAIDRRFRRDHDVRLGIAIVDTITAAFAIENENDNSQIASLMKVLKSVGEAVGVFMFGVHHFGKTTETGLRGASAFTDNSDIVIAVLADRDQINGRVENRRVSLSKSRDDVTGPIAPFDLRYVQVGVNEDGDEYGACYVEVGRTEDYVMKADAKKKRKLSNNGEMFMKALHVAIGEHGEKQHPFGYEGPKVKAVNREHIRDEFYKTCPADGDDEKAKSASRRQSFKRGFEAAQAANLIAMRDNLGVQWVWLAQGGGGSGNGEA